MSELNSIFGEFNHCLRTYCENEYKNAVTFVDIDDYLVIPENFKELKGIKEDVI